MGPLSSFPYHRRGKHKTIKPTADSIECYHGNIYRVQKGDLTKLGNASPRKNSSVEIRRAGTRQAIRREKKRRG